MRKNVVSIHYKVTFMYDKRIQTKSLLWKCSIVYSTFATLRSCEILVQTTGMLDIKETTSTVPKQVMGALSYNTVSYLKEAATF